MADVKEPTLAELLARMDAMQGTIEKQNETIIALKGKVAETKLDDKEELPTIPKENVKKDGKEYAWQVATFSVPKYGKITAAQAAVSDEIIELILSVNGQGILKELV